MKDIQNCSFIFKVGTALALNNGAFHFKEGKIWGG
jgi:hypothetical protein